MDSLRLRLLVLTPQLPYPPRQGTSIRNYNLIRYLARNHDIDLVSFLAPGDELSSDSPLHEICDRITVVPQPERSMRDRLISTILASQPDMALRLSSAAMFDVIDRLALPSYDAVQVEGIEMAPYGLHLAQTVTGRPLPPAFVFDDHNCEYLLQKRNALSDLRHPDRWMAATYSLVQWRKLRRYEQRVCDRADLVVAVSDPDRAALECLRISSEMIVAPNGIDTDAYVDMFGDGVGNSNIVFTGKMDYRPNIDAALWFGSQVFPIVQSGAPEATFQIVGQRPHPRLDALRSNNRIEITGEVPDVRPYLSEASVFVIPMRVGGGTRLKVLEAMAAGLPIVTTSLGIEGIPVQNDRELLIADSPAAFAEAVLLLLDDQRDGAGVSRRLGQAARRFVVACYDWANIVPSLEQALNEVAQRRASIQD